MTLFEQVSKDIVVAMKAKDKVRLQALRNIKKYFIEAKTAPGANDTLEDAAALKILAKLAKQGRDTAALYTEQGRPDLAEEEVAQAQVVEEYLPKALSAEGLLAQGHGQGDGRGHQETGRPRRRQGHLCPREATPGVAAPHTSTPPTDYPKRNARL